MPQSKTCESFPVGTQVVFNKLADATLFDVIAWDGKFRRVVREAGRADYAEQVVDVCTCRVPSAEQIENSKNTCHPVKRRAREMTERELNYWMGV